jgi:hypothetical protein
MSMRKGQTFRYSPEARARLEMRRLSGPTLEQRFWQKVDKSAGDDGCWLWTGSIVHTGYGSFNIGRGTHGSDSAHRVAYLLAVGCIPPKMQLDHLCRVRHCVNPRHLEVVTQQENLRRGTALITSCPQGHVYDEANTRYRADGHRQCRACDSAAHRAKRAATHSTGTGRLSR